MVERQMRRHYGEEFGLWEEGIDAFIADVQKRRDEMFERGFTDIQIENYVVYDSPVLRLSGERLETDEEMAQRLKESDWVKQMELRKLAELKAKYE